MFVILLAACMLGVLGDPDHSKQELRKLLGTFNAGRQLTSEVEIGEFGKLENLDRDKLEKALEKCAKVAGTKTTFFRKEKICKLEGAEVTKVTQSFMLALYSQNEDQRSLILKTELSTFDSKLSTTSILLSLLNKNRDAVALPEELALLFSLLGKKAECDVEVLKAKLKTTLDGFSQSPSP
eukprot:GEMP01029530.1.p1 GENE.GEMP01029530.1~~GEMP01029530.1.p1  ORF type:complete len:181 (+),score=28.83 GEMP01029530.1:74-616(+)